MLTESWRRVDSANQLQGGRRRIVHIMESMKTSEVAGTQAVARSMRLLKLVSARTERGHLLAELVFQSGLTRPTVYRLLAALQAAGLVEQDERGRWHLGTECYVLGTLAAPRFNLEQLAKESLARIAEATGESAFLSVRRGQETVCLARHEGTYPIRTHALQAGDRLPLGIASAGLALLASLPDPEVDDVLTRLAPIAKRRYPRFSSKVIQQLVAEARSTANCPKNYRHSSGRGPMVVAKHSSKALSALNRMMG
jgi:DNA-binding IclR family transcriptional regulator